MLIVDNHAYHYRLGCNFFFLLFFFSPQEYMSLTYDLDNGIYSLGSVVAIILSNEE